MDNKERIALLGYVWPEDESSAAGFRTWNLIEIFQRHECEVHFLCASKQNKFTSRIRESGIQAIPIELNNESFDTLIEKGKYDFIIFDRFVTEEQFGARVEKASPDTIRIIDSQDFHSLRKSREKLFREKRSAREILDISPEWIESDLLREISAFYRADLTLILSDFEFDLLQEKFKMPEEQIFYLPFCYPNSSQRAPWSERAHFCFLGNFRHPPNFDSIFYLCRELWPEIRNRLPLVELHIYGAYPPKEVMQLNNPKLGIIVHGPVLDHIAMLEKYRLSLSPLRFGAGIKGKISDAWFAGLPSITTPLGAEGMADKSDWGGIIADNLEEFVNGAIELYTNEKDWNERRDNGVRILEKLFSMEKNSAALIQRMGELKKNIKESRKKNLTGAMLRYHLHRSTEFFSRWIEEKEKHGCEREKQN